MKAREMTAHVAKAHVVKAHVILPLVSRTLSPRLSAAFYLLNFMRGRILLRDIRVVLQPSALLAALNWHDVTAGDVT
jgi:hypothetical protein